MKTNKSKKHINKFDLEKFNVAKLKNLRSINGGITPAADDDKTITDLINQGNDRKA
jgi:hypothetical protein